MARAVRDVEHERVERRVRERLAGDEFLETRAGGACGLFERGRIAQVAVDHRAGRGAELGQARVHHDEPGVAEELQQQRGRDFAEIAPHARRVLEHACGVGVTGESRPLRERLGVQRREERRGNVAHEAARGVRAVGQREVVQLECAVEHARAADLGEVGILAVHPEERHARLAEARGHGARESRGGGDLWSE